MLDVLLSLVVVGIPERTASEGRGVEVEGAGGSDEECRAQDVDERVEAGQASLDTVEGLLLDGTLAFHVDAVADAPWSCLVPPKKRTQMNAALYVLPLLYGRFVALCVQHDVSTLYAIGVTGLWMMMAGMSCYSCWSGFRGHTVAGAKL